MVREKRSYDITEVRKQIYWDLPSDIGPVRGLLEDYSGIEPEEVNAHILAIREKLWRIKPYGCIGRFRFLNLDFTADPGYQQAIGQLRKTFSNTTFLDLGCCVGQVLRQLAHDGAWTGRLYGTDLEPRFMDVGYELFNDKKRLRSTFVAGDIFSDRKTQAEDPLRVLDGRITIVHATSFFHLFGWDDQVRAARRVVRLLKPRDQSAFIFGRQVGCDEPSALPEGGPGGRQDKFLHNAESWQRMWDVVGEETGTRWRTEWDVIPDSPDSAANVTDDSNSEMEGMRRIRFGVYRE
ncbi:hypothetical protein BJ166DRAFT_491904 [Pestalotiopsis sp. NC0098]|nr:hypothetical protein BJ166DRAFT_491904 [Pestalotiopsis sp. NC0098]